MLGETIVNSMKKIQIPCPENVPGCTVLHYSWVPVNGETNDERLERCKTFADATDIDWLIEQAERVEELEKENARLREALEFYANNSNWTEPTTVYVVDRIEEEVPMIFIDNGENARQALEKVSK